MSSTCLVSWCILCHACYPIAAWLCTIKPAPWPQSDPGVAMRPRPMSHFKWRCRLALLWPAQPDTPTWVRSSLTSQMDQMVHRVHRVHDQISCAMLSSAPQSQCRCRVYSGDLTTMPPAKSPCHEEDGMLQIPPWMMRSQQVSKPNHGTERWFAHTVLLSVDHTRQNVAMISITPWSFIWTTKKQT